MVEFASQFGYLGIILFLVATGAGLPLPEELAVIAAGVMSSSGVLDPTLAFISCLAGALLGDSVVYFLGYYFGHNLARHHPRCAKFLHADREQQLEAMIRQHGLKVFFLARFLVGVRCPIYLAAGALRVPFRRFIMVDAVCATTVVGLFFGLSYRYADHIVAWFAVIQSAERLLTLVLVVLGVGAGIWYWRKHRQGGKRTPKEDETNAVPLEKDKHSDSLSETERVA